MQRRQDNRAWLHALVACSLTWSMAGCAPKLSKLRPQDFETIRTQKDWFRNLDVYPSFTPVVVFPSHKQASVRAERGVLVDQSHQERYVVKVKRDARGRIVWTDTHNGKTWLWVSFTRKCRQKSCAFGYVETERDRFSLAKVPPAHGYLPATVFREEVEHASKMRLARLRRLDEAHEVWYWTGEEGVKSLDLRVERVKRQGGQR